VSLSRVSLMKRIWVAVWVRSAGNAANGSSAAR